LKYNNICKGRLLNISWPNIAIENMRSNDK
jgi:hypothetical protein